MRDLWVEKGMTIPNPFGRVFLVYGAMLLLSLHMIAWAQRIACGQSGWWWCVLELALMIAALYLFSYANRYYDAKKRTHSWHLVHISQTVTIDFCKRCGTLRTNGIERRPSLAIGCSGVDGGAR